MATCMPEKIITVESEWVKVWRYDHSIGGYRLLCDVTTWSHYKATTRQEPIWTIEQDLERAQEIVKGIPVD